MKRSRILPYLAAIFLCGCGAKASQLVVLYKDSVGPGNSVVSLLNHNDETGQFASVHCEELRRMYEAKERIKYICSTVVFDDFKPSIK